LSPDETRTVEGVVDASVGVRVRFAGTGTDRVSKGLLLRDKFIKQADCMLQGADEIVRIILERIVPLGAQVLGESCLLLSVDVMDTRTRQKGNWHVDTDTPGSRVTCMVPVDDVDAGNGGTLVKLPGGQTVALYGQRGHVYCFRGDLVHCAEGNPSGALRRILSCSLRPERLIDMPEHSLAFHKRAATLHLRGPVDKRAKTSAAPTSRVTRSHPLQDKAATFAMNPPAPEA
jgi:ectoine hydroxylase-related dioxygenase (phytanoyl-CoA dioxygenase family)